MMDTHTHTPITSSNPLVIIIFFGQNEKFFKKNHILIFHLVEKKGTK